MADHIHPTPHLTVGAFDSRIAGTYLGQAHIAGTGPEGTTCRMCVHWHAWRWKGRGDKAVRVAVSPGYSKGELAKASCNKPIMNKARRRVPHFAPSCSFFVNNQDAPDARP